MLPRLTSLNDHPSITLEATLTVIGRQETCNARICSSRVSRRHCCLIRDGEQVVVFDLRSSNGIRINGRRVEDGILRPGDILDVAHLGFRFEIVEEDVGEGADDDRGCRGPEGSDGLSPGLGPDGLPDTKDYAWRPSLEG